MTQGLDTLIKKCGRCRIDLPRDQFSKSAASKSGLQCYCKPCCRENHLERKANATPEQLDERRRRNSERSNAYYHRTKRLTRREKVVHSPTRRAALQLYYRARKQQRKYAEKCDITVQWIEELITTGHCARSGLEFSLDRQQGQINPLSPSLDRIDSRKGYTISNCQIVCTIYNVAKNNYSDDYFIEFCRRVTQFNPTDTTDT